MQQPFHCLLLLFLTIIIHSLSLSSGYQSPWIYPSANISTKWTNSPSFQQTITLPDGGIVRPILLRRTSDAAFACGFICSGSCKSFLFSVFILPYSDGSVANITYEDPQIVWSANRNRLVPENSTLELSKTGDLLLRDFDGTTVWSTDTSGKSVVGMDVNEVGSLVLFDDKNKTVWSSMDYPTDSLVLGQSLKPGQRLTANISVTNSSEGPVYLSIVPGGFQAFVGSQLYCQNTVGVLDAESCKQACSKNCSCKAALFKYGVDASSGDCYLPSELYSMTKNNPGITGYNSSAFIKVQPDTLTSRLRAQVLFGPISIF